MDLFNLTGRIDSVNLCFTESLEECMSLLGLFLVFPESPRPSNISFTRQLDGYRKRSIGVIVRKAQPETGVVFLRPGVGIIKELESQYLYELVT